MKAARASRGDKAIKVTAAVMAEMRPPMFDGGDKSDRGTVLVAAGGGAVPGAAILTGLASLRVGAGRLQLAAPSWVAASLGIAVPEAMIIDVPGAGADGIGRRAARRLAGHLHRCEAVVVGPGMISEGAARRLARELLAVDESLAFVIDAAAMPGFEDAAAFAGLSGGRVVLTPHAGEMVDMIGRPKEEIEGDPLDAARTAARRFGSVVVMKGERTFIASPDGKAWLHAHDVPGLATSGSGDVLAGAIAGLLARGSPPVHAAVWGVDLHAAAGAELSKSMPLGFLARELLDALPLVLASRTAR